MTSSNNKTKPTTQTVKQYIATLSETQQQQVQTLLEVFSKATGMQPVMWGSMVGYGSYHYVYESGREGDFFATGFAIRAHGPTVYIMPGYQDYGDMLANLGPHKLGKSCLYIKNLDNIDMVVLTKLIKRGLRDLAQIYPVSK